MRPIAVGEDSFLVLERAVYSHPRMKYFRRGVLAVDLFPRMGDDMPKIWYQKNNGEPERWILPVCRGARGAASSPPGGLGLSEDPQEQSGTAGGLRGGSPPVRTILWTQSQDFETRIYRESIVSLTMMHLS